MLHFDLKYGKGRIGIELPEAWEEHIDIIGAPADNDTDHPQDEDTIIRDALDHPRGCPPLESMVSPGESVVVITSDISRPMPTYKVLPPVIERLFAAGAAPEDITIVFALGIHRKHTAAEREALLGSAAHTGIRAVDSNPEDVVHLGFTPRGTPVEVFRPVVEADRVVCLGNVEYHYFAGYSGGYKAVLPGVCNSRTVTHNHRMLLDPRSKAGVMDGNPVKEDIDSVADLLPVDFIVNVVLDRRGLITFCASGHPIEAHRRASEKLDEMNQVEIPTRADFVVAGAGGHPKDMNLYQAQKALEFATNFALEGAPILLLAACPEGYGNEAMKKWLQGGQSPRDLLDRLRNEFQLGGHKAAMIARAVIRNPVWMVSDMPETVVREAFFEHVPRDGGRSVTLPAELANRIEDRLGEDSAIYVLPNAASILARVRD
ncbi:MAG: nickel-dependent lactate racemase [Clostridia bacterium]